MYHLLIIFCSLWSAFLWSCSLYEKPFKLMRVKLLSHIIVTKGLVWWKRIILLMFMR